MRTDDRKLSELTRDELCELVVELADQLDEINWGDADERVSSYKLRERIEQLRREE